MNIANHITGSATAAQRVTAEASLPPLREGYSRTRGLLDHIADAGPILEALSAIAHHLEAGHPIPGAVVEKARKSLDTCLRAYKRLPLTLIRDAAQMEEVSIGFELLGVK